MPYKKMYIDYFRYIEDVMNENNYVKVFSKSGRCIISIINKNNDALYIQNKKKDKKFCNILGACLDLSEQINDGINPFPQYRNVKLGNKSLDILILNNYEIYFYKLDNGQFLGMIFENCNNEFTNIYNAIGDSLKDCFELLDKYIYDNFGFYAVERLEKYVLKKKK